MSFVSVLFYFYRIIEETNNQSAYFSRWCCIMLFAGNASEWNVIQKAAVEIKDSLQCNVVLYDVKEAGRFREEGAAPFFEAAFESGFRKVIMPVPGFIPDLEIVKEAFLVLKMLECCLSPDQEGNVAMIGMNCHEPTFFSKYNFSEPVPYKDLLKTISTLKMAVYKLPRANSREIQKM